MISLFRIDDRLIHGQVICGWGIKLNPDKYIIIDDEIEDWEKDLYIGSLENEAMGMIVNSHEASKLFPEWLESKEHLIILVKSPFVIQKLESLGVKFPQKINLGGLHYLEGKTRYMNGLYLYDNEKNAIQDIVQRHIIQYQPLPSDNEVDIKQLLIQSQ